MVPTCNQHKASREELLGDVDPEKLDNSIDTLETYFTIYKYYDVQKIKFASLKLSSNALTGSPIGCLRIDLDELQDAFEKTFISSWL
ncbi:hypothetical protein L3X38_041203 [Prunus dulcis]|uniref:Uncharacterized protein n=1 Tax=Prunus dulcis TaxID=3755 RepID=A0AAD4US87_PRUDU|nr:hypothetical protein L3X38_041203 [Prunus dulcis]